MENIRLSKWTFDTSAGVDVGLGAAAFSGGMISLKDPNNKAHHLHYGGFGAGLSVGARLTKISVPDTLARNYDLSGSGSTPDFYSKGQVFMTEAFKGHELTLVDLQGAALYVEAGLALIAAAGFTVMYLGIDPIILEAAVMAPMVSSMIIDLAISQARAVLTMRAAGMGPQVGDGFSGLIGLLR